MKRIKENELKEIMDNLNNKNLKIEVNGIFKQVIFFRKVQIIFFDNNIEILIKDNENNIVLNMSYIEEIYFLEKNKLKFLTEIELEILICIL